MPDETWAEKYPVGEPIPREPQWEEGRWWRVIGKDGELWCETSRESEARASMRPGDRLQRCFVNEQREWRNVDSSEDGPLGDGPSFAHDVKPLEEELALAKAHPEYGIDTEAVEAALREAKADAAGKGAEHEG